MTPLSKKKYIVSFSLICGIICISFLFGHIFGKDQPETTQIPQSAHNKPLGPIIKGTIFIQELKMKKDLLHGVEIELATWNRKNTNLNKLVILNQEFSIIDEIVFSSDSIKDNSFQLFKLKSPVKIGKDHSFYICLLSDNGKLKNCITAWTDTTEISAELFKEPIIENRIAQAVKTRKNQIKGGLQIKILESESTKFLKSFLFIFFLLGFSMILTFKLTYKQQRKNHEEVFTSILIITLFVPSLYFIFFNTNDSHSSNWEKRMLATFPVLNLQNLNTYLPQLESYINDHIPFREDIISFRSRIYYKFFNKSSFPKTAFVGKNGWIFRTREVFGANSTLTISDEEAKKISELFHERAQYYNSLGSKFYIAVVPFKSEIYNEYLPYYCMPRNTSTIENNLLIKLSNDTTLNLIDLKPVLLEAKEEGQVFYKTDMHWTALGAYHGYKAIINRIKEDFPSINCLDQNDIEINEGELTSLCDATEIALHGLVMENNSFLSVKENNSIELPKTGYHIPEIFKYHKDYLIIKGRSNSTLPKIVVIRDSFTMALTEILSENFSKTTFVWDYWKYGLNKEIVEVEKPDMVLVIIYLGFLPNVLDSKE